MSVTEIYVFCPSEVNVRSHVCVVLSWEVNARSHVYVVHSWEVNAMSRVCVVFSWEVNARRHVCVVLSWEVNARSHVCVVLSRGVNVRSYVFVFVILSFLPLSLSMVISTMIFVEVFFCLEIWKVKEEIIHLRLVIITSLKWIISSFLFLYNIIIIIMLYKN